MSYLANFYFSNSFPVNDAMDLTDENNPSEFIELLY
jgi:hypothetical protein